MAYPKFIALVLLAAAVPASTASIVMTAGETKIMPLFTGRDVLVSRKGIVKVAHLNGDMFELIALKEGVVLLQARDNPQQRLLVKVQRRTVRDDQLDRREICRAAGVVCRAAAIGGRTNSLEVFLRARASCGEKCLFTLRLDEQAAQQWQKDVQQLLGKQYTVARHGNAQLVASVFCRQQDGRRTRKLADDLSGGYVRRGVLRVMCMNHFDFSQYQLTAKIVLFKQSEAQEMGFADLQQLVLLRPDRLDWHKLRNVSHVIGEPKFSIVNGASAKFETGGEIQYTGYDKHSNTSIAWKFYGLSLQVQLDKINAQQAQLQLDFALKNPTTADNGNLNSSRFTSTVLLNMAQPKAVSVIGYHNSVVAKRALPVLHRVPIVGPLFNHKKNERALHKIIIWFTLAYDDEHSNADLLHRFQSDVEPQVGLRQRGELGSMPLRSCSG